MWLQYQHISFKNNAECYDVGGTDINFNFIFIFVEFFQSASSLSTSKKLIFGLFIVIAIATSWVGSTQTAKSTYDGRFKAPFFLVWFSTSWMMLIYPITVPLYFILNWKLPTWNNLRALWR